MDAIEEEILAFVFKYTRQREIETGLGKYNITEITHKMDSATYAYIFITVTFCIILESL